VLVLVLIFVLLWVALIVILWAGSLWFQGYIYNQPAEEMYWRAPAAGSALALFFVLWGFLDYQAPGRYQSLFDFSPTDTLEFAELRAVPSGSDKEVEYHLRKNTQGIGEYRDSLNRPLPSHPQAIIVKINGEDDRFEPERDKNNNYKIQQGRTLRYLDAHGREMYEDKIGQISTRRWGILLANLLLNFFHLGVWFACLWLLLQFQWSHALGIALVFWGIMTVILLPMLLGKVEKVAHERQPPAARTAPS
jgi:hypothetical protein